MREVASLVILASGPLAMLVGILVLNSCWRRRLARAPFPVRAREPLSLAGTPTPTMDRNGDDRSVSVDGARLIRDAEALLSGDYAEQMRRRGDSVPRWVWLNALAHNDLAGIRRSSVTTSATLASRQDRAWLSARTILANELLELVAGDPERLARLQRTVLVPRELQLIHSEAPSELTPAELIRSVTAALRSNIA